MIRKNQAIADRQALKVGASKDCVQEIAIFQNETFSEL